MKVFARVGARASALVAVALMVSGLAATAADAATYAAPVRVGPYFDFPTGVAVDTAGNVFVADSGSGTPIKKVSASDRSSAAPFGSGFSQSRGVAVDNAGNVYVADTGNARVVKVSADGANQTVIGSGFTAPSRVAVDAAGDVFVVDNGAVIEVTAAGVQRQLDTGVYASAVAVDTSLNLYVAAGGTGTVVKFAPPYDRTTSTSIASGLNAPLGLASDNSGNVFVDSTFDNQVVQIDPAGNKTTVATGLSQPYGVDVDKFGNLYVADSGNYQILEYVIQRDLATTTTVNCGPAAAAGTGQQCTATVTANGSTTVPTGNVSFSASSAGTFNRSSCTLDATGACSVTFTPAAFGDGSQTITANYQGDTGFKPSSGTTKLTVAQGPTSTKVACDPATVSIGSSTTCTVTVSTTATGGAPSGTVTVKTSTSGLSAGSCNLTANSDGSSASCQVTDTPTLGSQTITASYPGSTAFTASSGQTVVSALDPTRTTLVCTPSAPFIRLAVCTVVVTDTAARPSTPTGSVTFTGTAGMTVPASCKLTTLSSNSAGCVIMVSTGTLSRAALTANYPGTATQAASTSGAVPIWII